MLSSQDILIHTIKKGKTFRVEVYRVKKNRDHIFIQANLCMYLFIYLLVSYHGCQVFLARSLLFRYIESLNNFFFLQDSKKIEQLLDITLWRLSLATLTQGGSYTFKSLIFRSSGKWIFGSSWHVHIRENFDFYTFKNHTFEGVRVEGRHWLLGIIELGI